MNTSNSRTERNNRTTNTVATGTTAEMLTAVKPAKACREANNNMDIINIKDNSSTSREASNFQQRDASNISRNSQLLLNIGNSQVGGSRDGRKKITDVNSRRETCKSRDASNSRDANKSTSISRTSAATVWSPTTHDFLRKFDKNLSESLQI